MTICREWVMVKRLHADITVQPLKCKCWHCEYCAPIRQRQLRALGFSGKPNRFLTLTVNPAHFESPSERAVELVKAWRMLRRKIMRENKWKTLPFLAVFEKTKKGEPHLHILLRCGYIPQDTISKYMGKRMGAPIVDIRFVSNAKKAAAYVSKYIGKDPAIFGTCKRYWRSKDWELPGKKKPGVTGEDANTSYEIKHMDIHEYAKAMHAWGFDVEWQGDGSFTCHAPQRGPPCRI